MTTDFAKHSILGSRPPSLLLLAALARRSRYVFKRCCEAQQGDVVCAHDAVLEQRRR